MALRASGGVCAGKTLCIFSDFATTAVGVFWPRKLARFYHGSWHSVLAAFHVLTKKIKIFWKKSWQTSWLML